MSESRSHSEHKANSSRLLTTAFLIYGMMVGGLLGYFYRLSRYQDPWDARRRRPVQTAAKAVRYEAVIANWNRYRNKDARADAR